MYQKKKHGGRIRTSMWAKLAMDEKRKATLQLKQTIQIKERSQKVLAKEGRLKRYRDRIKQCTQNRRGKNAQAFIS